jgi:flagellar hook-associated protein 1 FlgK
MDEEMSNMIKFQKGYNAAARVLTTMDEMLDKLINGTGIVGR